MNFNNISILPYLLILFTILLFLFYKQSRAFSEWIASTWAVRQKKRIVISQFILLFAVLLLLLSLLDPRGKEQRISGSIPEEKTIILVDASMSMLVEDVRPNRFQKALLLAQHFVKKAIGHQVSVILFSDTHNKFVPFTTDIDLLVSRLQGLKTFNIRNGGSNLSMAITEAIQYFKQSKSKEIRGNILLITDSEETYDPVSLEIPNGVTMGVIGVGTRKGGRIPLRNEYGLQGYKRFNGKEVISKLDEEKIKKLGEGANYFKYWIATSYTLPTDEIVKFFTDIHFEKNTKGDMIVKPILFHYFLVPFFILYILFTLLRKGEQFTKIAALIVILVKPSLALSQDESTLEDSKTFDTEKIKHLRDIENLNLKKLSIANDLVKDKNHREEASVLFSESFNNQPSLVNKYPRSYMNLGFTHLEKKRVSKGLDILYLKNEAATEEEKKTMRANILLALRTQKKDQQNQKKQDQKDKDKKKNDKQDQKSQGSKGSKDKQENQSNKKSDEKSQKDQQENKEKQEEQKSPEQQHEMKKQQLSKLKKKKIPSLLKQLISEDGNLQKQIVDPSSSNRNNKRKDW